MRIIMLAAFAVCTVYAPAYAESSMEERLITYSGLCKTAADAKNLNDAVLYCKQANEIRSVAETHVNVGSALFAHGRYEEAKFHFIEAVNMNPKLRVAQYDLALACNVLGQKECALKHYTLAAELGDPDAIKELASLNTVATAAPKP
jgi:tetratricopeptide (TPR) repeat protein